MVPSNQRSSMQKMFEEMTGWPSPDKLFAEIQRLNNNMEKMAPDLHKIAQSTDGFYAADIRVLTQVLQGMNLSHMISALKDAKDTFDKLYTKLWGK